MTTLAGTGALARLIVRRDRVRLPVWIYVIAGLVISTAASWRSLYPTVAERVAFGESIRSNATLRALDGQIYNLTTTGGLTAWRICGISAVVAALMSILTVVRHTRAEEEAGRLELVGAGVVGRFAPLTAALLVVTAANVIAGALMAAGLIALGTGVAGSLALGASTVAGGLAFAAVAAIAVQVPESSRTANGIALGTLGMAFVLRAAGDGGSSTWLSWLSPIGWAQQVRAYADERWWVFALVVAFAALAIGAAFALVARRDVGSGLVPARLGPAVAPPSMRGPFGLAWRQQRGALLGWGAAYLLLGVVIGGSAKSVGSILDSSSQLRDAVIKLGGPGALTDTYFVAILALAGLVAAAYAIQATLRLRSEETGVRAEPLLATPLTRWRFMASHLVLALLGTAALLVVWGLGAGLTYGLAIHDVSGQVGRLIGAALIQWPAAALLAGVVAVLFGRWPRATTGAWALLAAFAALGQFGPLLRLAQPVMDVSPFTHVPKMPGGALALTPVISLALIAAALVAAGLFTFRRRDIG